MSDHRFFSESGGALLSSVFADDEVALMEIRESRLVVRDAEAVVDEFQRLRYTLEPGLRTGATGEALTAGVRREVRAIVGENGAFHISESHGLFTCRRLAM